MAVKKKAESSGAAWRMSWKNFFIAASVTLNIAFLVIFMTMISTNALDGMFITVGVEKYCSPNNDGIFEGNTDQVKALRDFTCAKGEAKQAFENAFNGYLHEKGVEHNH